MSRVEWSFPAQQKFNLR